MRRRNGERESQLEPSHGLTSIAEGNENDLQELFLPGASCEPLRAAIGA